MIYIFLPMRKEVGEVVVKEESKERSQRGSHSGNSRPPNTQQCWMCLQALGYWNVPFGVTDPMDLKFSVCYKIKSRKNYTFMKICFKKHGPSRSTPNTAQSHSKAPWKKWLFIECFKFIVISILHLDRLTTTKTNLINKNILGRGWATHTIQERAELADFEKDRNICFTHLMSRSSGLSLLVGSITHISFCVLLKSQFLGREHN